MIFRAKRADRIKLLVWDGSGLVLIWKRLESSSFKWPPITDGVMRLSAAQLAALLEGLDWTRVHVPRQGSPEARAIAKKKADIRRKCHYKPLIF